MRRHAATLAVAALAMAPMWAVAQGEDAIRVRSTIVPGAASLGETVTLRGHIIDPAGRTARWAPPGERPDITFGTLRSGVSPVGGRGRPARGARRIAPTDTQWVEVTLQAFELGTLDIPGLRFELAGDGAAPIVSRLPVRQLEVLPVMTAADSQASLRPPRGPLAAPWWERVPWRWVVLGVLALIAVVLLVRWLRRRRRPAQVIEAPKVTDPVAEALAALAALREQRLAHQGHMGEHAFRLGQILRRFLEATVATTRPGDTTPELVAHLRDAGLDAETLRRLTGLLRVWDRVKFARDPFSLEEALRAEQAVEDYVQRAGAAAIPSQVA